MKRRPFSWYPIPEMTCTHPVSQNSIQLSQVLIKNIAKLDIKQQEFAVCLEPCEQIAVHMSPLCYFFQLLIFELFIKAR